MSGIHAGGFQMDQAFLDVSNSVVYSTDRIRSIREATVSAFGDEAVSRSSKHNYRFYLPNYLSTTSFNSSNTFETSVRGGVSVINQPFVASSLPTDILEQCRKEFVKVASSEQVEYGYSSASEQLLERFFEQHKLHIGAIVQHIYVREAGNPKVLVPLLKAVANFEYSAVYPHAQVMALAALINVDPEVREAGIRAYENWEHPDGIEALKAAETPWDWLNSYRLATIAYLESFA